MSDRAFESIAAAIRFLASAVLRLARAVESRGRAASEHPSESVGQIGPASGEPDPAEQSSSSWSPVSPIADEPHRGDTFVPYHFRERCRLSLSDRAPGPDVRALQAYQAGVRVRSAKDTDARYTPRVPFEGSKARHWIVLRSTPCDPFRTTCASGISKAGIDRADPLLILEAFDSVTEASVFCDAAQERLPPLQNGED